MSRVLSFVLLPLFYPVHVAGVGGGNLTVVDLGYAVYTGIHNSTTGLHVWKGIRYAAPPVGTLRWQAPQPLSPTPNITTAPVTADQFGPACPQAFPMYAHAGAPLFVAGDEDCLFLNVYAPAPTNIALKLPVVVVIHGGGYGEGDGAQDMSPFINTNDNSFIAVVIQYRLGAFGFLASREVGEKGVLNAGLLDQRAALEWVRDYVGLFGGDKQRVTVMGECGGAGSVLLHVLAPGDVTGGLFQNKKYIQEIEKGLRRGVEKGEGMAGGKRL
ncbi:putative carboxylesterase family protein [Diplogelasinospora grovesii]|uniref:Carboxylesterase family protein n=1 Tax=Diplogelasinospora grovesii TaxID=303347 RepID=A0AAN6S2G9_9PEZI|nr:putative carboxylesterase family protein [Diplogelasinospora grovesii]